MKTYSRDAFLEAKQLWLTGDFSLEWEPFRRLAADRGFIYPPDGTRWDSWDDEEPSQRALLIRAIRETPSLLRSCIVDSRTWGEVVRKLLAGRDRMREDARFTARDDAWERSFEPTNHESTQILADILQRIHDSDPRDAA